MPEQLFVRIDQERIERGPDFVAGLATALDAGAQQGADAAPRLPPRPGPAYGSVTTEWIGDIDNGLDADFQWLYNDGPDSGVPGCSGHRTSGCWADRRIVLARSRDTASRHGDRVARPQTGRVRTGTGPRLRRPWPPSPMSRHYSYTWREALASMSEGRLQPLRAIPSSESDTGIQDPGHNVAPSPDYTHVCRAGTDDSPACIGAVLAAIDHAHAGEGIRPMVLPNGFASMSIPDQLFVAVNLERVDRRLPAFGGLTTALDQDTRKGADDANDPPDPGQAYDLDDAEWAGGSSNGLDAVYGWMYDDGFDSGNLDCLRRGAAGCWGHRKGILDDFGSGPNLVMGAAVDMVSDTHKGDIGGTSMAVTLAVASVPVHTFTYSWAQVVAAMPPGGV